MNRTLADENLLYRRPELHDALSRGDAKPGTIADLINRYRPDAGAVLDLGCGTGADLAHLADRYVCVGVDCQAQMIAHGNHVRPQLDLRIGDMTELRLAERFDVILCVGNALAYLANHAQLAATFNTFAAHATAGALLIIQTIGAPVPASKTTRDVVEGDFAATVITTTEWDPHRQVSIMHRQWKLHTGGEVVDRTERYVTPLRMIDANMRAVGFEPLLFSGEATEETFDGWPKGPELWAVGRLAPGIDPTAAAGVRLPWRQVRTLTLAGGRF